MLAQPDKAGNANYANTAGYANSSGLPAWRQEQNSLVGTTYGNGGWILNRTGNTLLVLYDECSNGYGLALVTNNTYLPGSTHYVNSGRGFCDSGPGDYVLGAYAG
jgi:hypothetical protein